MKAQNSGGLSETDAMFWILMQPRTIAMFLALGWSVLYALHEPMQRPRERAQPLIVRVNAWPEPCFYIGLGGGELPPVAIDLGFSSSTEPDLVHFSLDLNQSAFAVELREYLVRDRARVDADEQSTNKEKAARMSDIASAENAGLTALLYTRYLRASKDVRDADAGYFLNWLVALLFPSIAALVIGFAAHTGGVVPVKK